MSWGQFQGNCTHQLHLKEILPVFKLTHISELSNSLTSAVDSLCSHGFTHTSVWHVIQRVQSPFATASNLAKSQKAKPKRLPPWGSRPSLKVPLIYGDWKWLLFKRAGKNMKGRIISAWMAKPNSEEQVLQRMTQTHMMFSRDGVFTGEGAVCSAFWPEATLTLTAIPPHHNVDQEDLVLSAQSCMLSLPQSLE